MINISLMVPDGAPKSLLCMTKPRILVFREIAHGESVDALYRAPVKTPLIVPAHEMSQRPHTKLFVAWEGACSLKGVRLPNGTIDSLQNDVLYTKNDRALGMLIWLERFGGERGNSHKAVISLSPLPDRSS